MFNYDQSLYEMNPILSFITYFQSKIPFGNSDSKGTLEIRMQALIDNHSTMDKAPSICSDLHLNTEELHVADLLEKPIYRRLYNIVISDTNRTEFHYRKNLIKELYFLLKITPIMKSQLQDSYLQKLEEWYNLNDHKKTELGSGKLKSMISEFTDSSKPKGNRTIVRPQSGVCWSKSVSPFLRPYTAKRTQNSDSSSVFPQYGQSQFLKRPDSYKSSGFSGKSQVNQSTKVDSCQELTLRQFAHSIQQEIDISEQFTQKHRTIHPESEPIYEQLYSIIQKAHTGQTLKSEYIKPSAEEKYLIRETVKRADFGDIFSTQKNSQISHSMPSSTNEKQGIKQQSDPIEDDHIREVQEFDENLSEGSHLQQELQDGEQESQILSTNERKAFKNDRKQENFGQNKNEPHRGKVIKGYAFAQVQNKDDEILLRQANSKYSHLTGNKFVNFSKNDEELTRSYVNYTRVKSAMKREMNRKSESKRLLSAKCRSTANITMKQRPESAVQRCSIKLAKDKKCNQQSDFQFCEKDDNLGCEFFQKQKSTIDPSKVFDFSSFGSDCQNKENTFVKSPSAATYNQRKALHKLYTRPIETFKKFNKNSINTAEITVKNQKVLTKHDNFLSREKISPIAQIHIERHNEEALEEIQKIKQKMSASSNKGLMSKSLMKALYIDSYSNVNSCTTIAEDCQGTKAQQADDFKEFDQLHSETALELDWTKRNPFFNMLSNGAKKKKMKKKHRKLKKKV